MSDESNFRNSEGEYLFGKTFVRVMVSASKIRETLENLGQDGHSSSREGHSSATMVDNLVFLRALTALTAIRIVVAIEVDQINQKEPTTMAAVKVATTQTSAIST